MRPIDADYLKTKVCKVCEYPGIIFEADLDDAPTLDMQPVVHAHWKIKDNPEELCSDTDCECSNCGASAPIGFTFDWDFCPYCGAKMDEEEE